MPIHVPPEDAQEGLLLVPECLHWPFVVADACGCDDKQPVGRLRIQQLGVILAIGATEEGFCVHVVISLIQTMTPWPIA